MNNNMPKAVYFFSVLARYCDVSKIIETSGTLKTIAHHFDAGYLATIVHCLKLHLIGRFTLKEIFRLGIADPATPQEVMAEVVSVVSGIQMQRAINPKGYGNVTEDKGVFYHYCMGAGISVPRLYAVFDPITGWTPNGELLNDKNGWIRFFQNDVPDGIVIKPSRGVQGKSVYILDRIQGAFTDNSSQRYSAGDLIDVLATNTEFDRFIIQEKLGNHPDLIELTGTAALQTVRIVTGIDRSGDVLIFFAAHKLVGGSNALDRFACGTVGNYLAELSVDQGRIVKVLTGTEGGFELAVLETHPKTGCSFIDFQVPYWQAVRHMVIDAAQKFLPIRTIGWDVAITPDGPVIIEGNTDWGIDHFSALRNCSPFTNYVKEMLGAGKKE